MRKAPVLGQRQLRMGPPNKEHVRGRNLLCELIVQRLLLCVTTIKARFLLLCEHKSVRYDISKNMPIIATTQLRIRFLQYNFTFRKLKISKTCQQRADTCQLWSGGEGECGRAQTWFTIANKGSQKALLNFLSKYVFWEQSDNHMLSINWTNTLVRYEMVPCCYKRHEKSKVNWILPLYK